MIPVARGSHHLDSRRPLPYQETLQAVRTGRLVRRHGQPLGVGNFFPFVRRPMGGPLPAITGGGVYNWASGTNRLTSVEPAAMPVREPCHLMAAIAAITGQREMAVRGTGPEHRPPDGGATLSEGVLCRRRCC